MALRAIQPGGSGVWCMSAWFVVDVDESVKWEVYSVWCTVPGDISASTAGTASIFSYSTWRHLC
jgi:hypothetical protein